MWVLGKLNQNKTRIDTYVGHWFCGIYLQSVGYTNLDSTWQKYQPATRTTFYALIHPREQQKGSSVHSYVECLSIRANEVSERRSWPAQNKVSSIKRYLFVSQSIQRRL
jgi:hypothetical protein